MTSATIVTLVAGLLAALGFSGILFGAAVRTSPHRQRIFRFGSIAMAVGGLVLMLGAMIGVSDGSNLFGGLMMLIFGTAVSLPGAATRANG